MKAKTMAVLQTLLGPVAALPLGAGQIASGGTGEWAFIQEGLVYSFDLAAPGEPAQIFASGLCCGNRGLDFCDPFHFYRYKSNGAERGLYFYDAIHNAGTLVYSTVSLPSTSNDGDVAYHNGRVYVTHYKNEQPFGWYLYAFANLDGDVTMTEIGSVGGGQLIGLAVHPQTGVLYGYNSGNDSLFTISTTDATATLVGRSEVNLSNIGGMDFNTDGSQLVILSFDTLYLADTSDGSLTMVGQFDPDYEHTGWGVANRIVSCPWDLDYDGVVGIVDFLDLLANWNNPYTIVDFLDLLANWGPC